MEKAPFITLEGGEGAGKTTQLKKLARRVAGLGLKVETTLQPGATGLGKAIRRLLQDPDLGSGPAPLAELMLYLADRAQHVETVIRPELEAGTVVICDRFADSSEVYQGLARGLGLDMVRGLNRVVCGDIWPDLTICLDLDPAVGLRRALGRQGELGLGPDRMEQLGLEFHRKVREGFLSRVKDEPERIKLVDASGGEERVTELIWEQVEPVLRKWRAGG